MCGIAGIFRIHGRIMPDDVIAVLNMMDAQIHRGPDDWGILLPEDALQDSRISGLLDAFDHGHVKTYPGSVSAPAGILGSRRLSIIDLSPRGRMPMGNAERRVWLTYNGEIYNFRELRFELEQRGYVFDSHTDTETILHAYVEWGDDVVQHLRGMFAFAILDVRPTDDPKLFLAKDRFGIKPLYYHHNRETLIFASEVRAIGRTGMASDEKNSEALFRFLQLGSVPAPLTTMKGVLAVPAGHEMTIARQNLTLTQYWDFSTYLGRQSDITQPVDHDHVIELTRELLDKSIALHLVGDVPLGIFLSGGIDSSSIVSLASQFRQTPLTTLCIVFDEPEYSEARYARTVAERYGTSHHEILLRDDDFYAELPRILRAMDQPTIDGVNTYFVSKVSKEIGLKAVLTGTGGDEVFLGYDLFKKARSLHGARRMLSHLPFSGRRMLVNITMFAGALMRKNGLERLAYLETPSNENVHLLFRGLFTPREVQNLLGIGQSEFGTCEPLRQPRQSSTPTSLLESIIIREFSHYLQNQLLKDTDVMSMAHSIETRIPLLDHRLVEYIAGLPTRIKFHDRMNKPLLVKALGADLPREVWDRPKMGFTFPFRKWMVGRAVDLQAKSLEQTFLDKDAVKDVWRRFREGRIHWSRPWAILVAAQFEQGFRQPR